MKILHAEDLEFDRNLIRQIIHKYNPNIQIKQVTNAKELLNCAQLKKYDLIITDNNMPPGIDGMEAFKILNTDTPTCIVTSIPMNEMYSITKHVIEKSNEIGENLVKVLSQYFPK